MTARVSMRLHYRDATFFTCLANAFVTVPPVLASLGKTSISIATSFFTPVVACSRAALPHADAVRSARLSVGTSAVNGCSALSFYVLGVTLCIPVD